MTHADRCYVVLLAALASSTGLVLGGCAAPPKTKGDSAATAATAMASPEQSTPVSMPATTYIVPTNAAYAAQRGVVSDLNFVTYDRGQPADHERLSATRDGATLVVELKRANSINFGSAIVYRVGVRNEKLENGYRVVPPMLGSHGTRASWSARRRR